MSMFFELISKPVKDYNITGQVGRIKPETKCLSKKDIKDKIQSGVLLSTLIKENVRISDIVESVGVVKTANLVFENSTTTQQIFNETGVTNTDLIKAGAVEKENGDLDFSKYDLSVAFRDTNLLPSQAALVLIKLSTPVEDFAKTQSKIPITPSLPITSIVDISNIYSDLSEIQKDNAKKLAKIFKIPDYYFDVLDFSFLSSFISPY